MIMCINDIINHYYDTLWWFPTTTPPTLFDYADCWWWPLSLVTDMTMTVLPDAIVTLIQFWTLTIFILFHWRDTFIRCHWLRALLIRRGRVLHWWCCWCSDAFVKHNRIVICWWPSDDIYCLFGSDVLIIDHGVILVFFGAVWYCYWRRYAWLAVMTGDAMMMMMVFYVFVGVLLFHFR